MKKQTNKKKQNKTKQNKNKKKKEVYAFKLNIMITPDILEKILS